MKWLKLILSIIFFSSSFILLVAEPEEDKSFALNFLIQKTLAIVLFVFAIGINKPRERSVK